MQLIYYKSTIANILSTAIQYRQYTLFIIIFQRHPYFHRKYHRQVFKYHLSSLICLSFSQCQKIINYRSGKIRNTNIVRFPSLLPPVQISSPHQYFLQYYPTKNHFTIQSLIPQSMTMRSKQHIRRAAQINVKQRYLEAHKKYVSSEFTHNSHCLIRKLCQNAEKQPSLYNVPLYKIMIQITKIMMMNELQLLFFGATVQQMGWKKVDQPCLNVYIEDVIDITPKIQSKGQFVKKLQLSLLLIAYIVKIYLNEQSTLYDFKIRDLVKNNFDKMYQEWVTKVQNHFKFSPKHMNKLFKEFDKGKKQVKQDIVDYNLLVSKLFDNNQDNENDYYNQQPMVNSRLEREKQREDDYHHHVVHNDSRIEGLPVRENEQLVAPSLRGRTFSTKSNVSGLGKRQSIHELFNEGELKPFRGISQFEQDFMGPGL